MFIQNSKRILRDLVLSDDRRALSTVFLTVLVLSATILAAHAISRIRMDHDSMQNEDIHFAWLEGNRILQGINPYERILNGDMRHNDKYATYLPGFYLFGTVLQIAGWTDFETWLRAWRVFLEAFYLGTGLLLFVFFWKQGGLVLPFLGLWFWLFGRWGLDVLAMNHLDPMALFFLLLGWILFRRYPIAAMVFIGVSLSIKHIGVVVVPLLLIRRPVRSAIGYSRSWIPVVHRVAAMSLIPAAISLPFLYWNAKAFILSILFSATRNADSHFAALAVDSTMGLTGLWARVPLLAMLCLLYAAAWRSELRLNAAALLAVSILLSFNTVLFRQYMLWASPFLLLTVADHFQARE